MKLICPSCGAVASAEAWTGNADARQCLKTVAVMPSSVSRNILPYLSLFRPQYNGAKGYRGLVWNKALRLAGEVAQLVTETHIQWKGKPARPIDAHLWGLAMERMVNSPPRRLPLESHGYLTSIAYDLANEADQAREMRHNQAERDGSFRSAVMVDRPAAQAELEPVMTMDEMTAIRKKNMGKKR